MTRSLSFASLALIFATACAGPAPLPPKDPATATKAPVDRFSAAAGHLMVRAAGNTLPAANAPIDFDQAPFVTQGLGPSGSTVRYYNFDVQPVASAPIYVLFREGASDPVDGQLNIVDTVPGEAGYNDFWRVTKVTVPADYVANTAASLSDLTAAGYAQEAQPALVNCPIVPAGSTATSRLGSGDAALHSGWYRGMVIQYFNFAERALQVDASGHAPLSDIWVAFNTNPADTGGGPASGFKTEPGSAQTHNVLATLPADSTYSPLWSVNVYDNAAFAQVHDLASASGAMTLATGVATVNCPVISAATN